MNWKCIFGHNWSEWLFIEEVDISDDRLERICKKCGKKDVYIGMTEECIVSGYKSPYIFKD